MCYIWGVVVNILTFVMELSFWEWHRFLQLSRLWEDLHHRMWR